MRISGSSSPASIRSSSPLRSSRKPRSACSSAFRAPALLDRLGDGDVALLERVQDLGQLLEALLEGDLLRHLISSLLVDAFDGRLGPTVAEHDRGALAGPQVARAPQDRAPTLDDGVPPRGQVVGRGSGPRVAARRWAAFTVTASIARRIAPATRAFAVSSPLRAGNAANGGRASAWRAAAARSRRAWKSRVKSSSRLPPAASSCERGSRHAD